MKPEVSVVIPAFNAGMYIKQCIESVLDQKYPSIEIIIVDDCSTDDTRDIVMQFDTGIVNYICLEVNFGGPSKPRNIGVKYAKGQYLVMLDADDVLTNNSIERRIEILRKNEKVGFVFCDGLRFSEKNGDYDETFLSQHSHFKKLIKKRLQLESIVIDSQSAYKTLAKGDFILPSGLMVRKSVYDNVGWYDETVTNGQDLDMSLRIANKYPVAYLDIIGFRQRVHNESISAQGHKLLRNKILLLKKNLARSDDFNSKLSFKRKIAENYLSLGYYYKTVNNHQLSKEYYFNSLRYIYSIKAIRGWLSSTFYFNYFK